MQPHCGRTRLKSSSGEAGGCWVQLGVCKVAPVACPRATGLLLLWCNECQAGIWCREKAIKARIEALEQQAGSGGGAAGEADQDERGDGDEAQRELWLLQVDLAALQVRRWEVCCGYGA